jgi:signal transduction histidine kinase
MDPLRPPLLRRLGVAHWVVIDCVVAALLVPVATVVESASAGPRGSRWADAVVIMVAVLGAALRRHRPRAALALVVLAGPVAMGHSTFPAPWLVVAFVMYMIPLRFPRREALWLLAGTLVVASAGVVDFLGIPSGRPGPNRVGALLAGALMITVGWTIGYAVRQQRMYAAGLRERAGQQAHEQVAEARRALSEERLRIARELHDVVAHTMSVIAVQAGGKS